jgi:chemotaxis protein histidine kinase CheA
MMEEAIATYREEAGELLAELETSLLDLEETPDDNDLINRVFRAMHTIKGSGAMFGFDEIATFTHEVETVFDMVRNGKMSVTKRLLDLTLKSRDHITYLLSCQIGEEVDRSDGDEIIAGLRQLVPKIEMPQKGSTEVPAINLPAVSEEELANESTWRIRGAGLDRDRIKAKAIERGLISATADVSDREIYAQIFAPGFSTAAKVTSVSGRGVGMDVVKRGIDGLRGSIGVDSVRGTGTTITLKIPLTLAIIESLLVKIGKDHFVLPLAAIEECIELTSEDIRNSHGRNLANVRGVIIPYIPLRQHFCITDQQPDIEQIVIADIHGTKVGFVVDHVVGEHQTVIKSLGKMYRDVKGISGATILGDGTVALILDMNVLLQNIEQMENS